MTFAADSILGILSGTKTQTRRVIEPQPDYDGLPVRIHWKNGKGWDGRQFHNVTPRWAKVIDRKVTFARLWVREFWIQGWENGAGGWSCIPPTGQDLPDRVFYRATDRIDGRADEPQLPWKAPRTMPRWASRLTLEVVEIRAEPVQEISEADALAEGVKHVGMGVHVGAQQPHVNPVKAYRDLWNSINAKRGFGWDTNPYCWVISFKRLAQQERKAA